MVPILLQDWSASLGVALQMGSGSGSAGPAVWLRLAQVTLPAAMINDGETSNLLSLTGTGLCTPNGFCGNVGARTCVCVCGHARVFEYVFLHVWMSICEFKSNCLIVCPLCVCVCPCVCDFCLDNTDVPNKMTSTVTNQLEVVRKSNTRTHYTVCVCVTGAVVHQLCN